MAACQTGKSHQFHIMEVYKFSDSVIFIRGYYQEKGTQGARPNKCAYMIRYTREQHSRFYFSWILRVACHWKLAKKAVSRNIERIALMRRLYNQGPIFGPVSGNRERNKNSSGNKVTTHPCQKFPSRISRLLKIGQCCSRSS